VVEVKIVLTPAHYALALIPLPHFYFHSRRNKSIEGQLLFLTRFCVDRIGARHKLKFENLSMPSDFFPRIEKLKQSSESPDTIANLFLHLDEFRRGFSPFRALRGFEAEAILSYLAGRQSSRLVCPLGVRTTFFSRDVVPLVDQGLTVVFNPIGVRRTRSQAHQDDAGACPQTEIHSTLKSRGLFLTHFDVRNDIA